MPIAKELLEILRCPQCKGAVRLLGSEHPVLECTACRLRYAVRDGIPIMLIDEAVAF